MARVLPINRNTVPRLPSSRDRVTIIGVTGSGKSQAALWHLSNANFDEQPWIIVDPKDEDDSGIGLIEGTRELALTDALPTKPGLYVVHPIPSQAELLDQLLMRVWERRRIGVYVDEGYMAGRGDGLGACLTQGRSRYIPFIFLCQRPRFVPRCVFTEATFIQCFALDDLEDRKTVQRFASRIPVDAELPQYHSWYYDKQQRKLDLLAPVPLEDVILSRINTRLDELQTRRVRYI